MPEKALKTLQGNFIQSMSPQRPPDIDFENAQKRPTGGKKGGLEFFMLNNPRLEEMNVQMSKKKELVQSLLSQSHSMGNLFTTKNGFSKQLSTKTMLNQIVVRGDPQSSRRQSMKHSKNHKIQSQLQSSQKENRVTSNILKDKKRKKAGESTKDMIDIL